MITLNKIKQQINKINNVLSFLLKYDKNNILQHTYLDTTNKQTETVLYTNNKFLIVYP